MQPVNSEEERDSQAGVNAPRAQVEIRWDESAPDSMSRHHPSRRTERVLPKRASHGTQPIGKPRPTPFWVLVNALQLLHMAIWSSVWISAALLVRGITRSDRLPLAMARGIWARGMLVASLSPFEVRGLERLDLDRSYLFASNHQSIIDIPALFRAIPQPIRFVARSNLGQVPFLGAFMRSVGMILVGDGRGMRSTPAIERAAALLEETGSLVTFPEGTRTRNGDVHRFKSGALAPAILANSAVVPVAIEGAFDVLRPGSFRPRRGWIRVTFGEPIETGLMRVADRRELSATVETAVRSLIDQNLAR